MNTTSQGRKGIRVRVGVVRSSMQEGISCITRKYLTRGMRNLGERR